MQRPPDDPGRRGAVAIIVREEKLLVIRRSQSVVAPGAFCFPGGHIEGQESEREALVRELREELDVEINPLRQVWRSVTPWKVQLSWWLADMANGQQPRANPAEVESVHWYTAAEMARLDDLLTSNQEFLDLVISGEIRLQ
jgi:8-oxo-dGTP diphosphatase